MKFDVVAVDDEKMVGTIYMQALRVTCALETNLPLVNMFIPGGIVDQSIKRNNRRILKRLL